MTSQRARSAARARERRRMLEQMYAGRPPVRCAIAWDDGCTGTAEDAHEPLTRARGGSAADRANHVPACRHCHDQAHHHPAEAERRGWLRKAPPPG